MILLSLYWRSNSWSLSNSAWIERLPLLVSFTFFFLFFFLNRFSIFGHAVKSIIHYFYDLWRNFQKFAEGNFKLNKTNSEFRNKQYIEESESESEVIGGGKVSEQLRDLKNSRKAIK